MNSFFKFGLRIPFIFHFNYVIISSTRRIAEYHKRYSYSIPNQMYAFNFLK